MKQNEEKHRIHKANLDVIRYHSFYPWHTSGEYKQFMRDGDQVILKNVNYFNKFDLYSKEDSPDISDEIKEYYSLLLDEYFPEILQW